jgi:hypothetical protein
LAAKSEAASAIRRIQAVTEEYGRKVRVLRTDNDSEFMAAKFAAYCADEGVTWHSRHRTLHSRTGWWSG